MRFRRERAPSDFISPRQHKHARLASQPSPDDAVGDALSPFESLPDEVILEVLLLLPMKTVFGSAARVCRRWARIVQREPIRKRHAFEVKVAKLAAGVVRPAILDTRGTLSVGRRTRADGINTLACSPGGDVFAAGDNGIIDHFGRDGKHIRSLRTPDSYPNNGAANPGNLVNHGGHQNDDAAHHDDNNNGNDDGDDGDGDDDGDDVDQEAVRVLKVTPDGLHLLAGLDDGAIQVWALGDAAHAAARVGRRQAGPMYVLQGHTATVRGISVTTARSRGKPASKLFVVSGAEDSRVIVWVLNLNVHGSPDGDSLHKSVGVDRAIHCNHPTPSPVWSLVVSATLQRITPASPKGLRVFWGDEDGAVLSLWLPAPAAVSDGRLQKEKTDTGTAERVAQQLLPVVTKRTGHTATVFTLALNDDDSTLVSGSQDCSISIWSVRASPADEGGNGNGELKLLRCLTGHHTRSILGLAFAENGWFFSCAYTGDCSVRVWRYTDEVTVTRKTGQSHARDFVDKNNTGDLPGTVTVRKLPSIHAAACRAVACAGGDTMFSVDDNGVLACW